jgi:hypothetical protein
MDDWKQESLVGRHPVASINRELPLETEIAFVTVVRVLRNDRGKWRAALDLPVDRVVPRIPAPQLTLVEPHFDSGGAQSLANPLGSLRVLRSVTETYRARSLSHQPHHPDRSPETFSLPPQAAA